MHVHIYLFKPIECTIERVNTEANYDYDYNVGSSLVKEKKKVPFWHLR